jgi:hypothetical protein
MSAENTVQAGGWLAGDGLELGEQGIYKLPRDHAWHSGPTYFVNDYFEWHYFTFLGTDKKTGHEVSLFLCMFSAGWSKELGRPLMFPVFAWHDTVTGEFQGTTFYPLGTLETRGSGTSDFGFTYRVKDPDGKGFQTSYDHAQEKWAFKSFCTDESKILGKPYQVDVTGFVQEPGYVPAAYWGLESIGYSKLYNQNPETMYGLTYYYFAPQMEMSGTVTLADGAHEIEGVAWYEHQWGNYRNTENARYFWGYARFDNGDAFTWRQYYGNPVGKLDPEVPFDVKAAREAWDDPHPEVSRFAFVPKGEAPRYAFGPSFSFTPTRWWTSPDSGVEYPWWGEMRTPEGTFYLSPTFPAQESIATTGSFIEGALLLRKDSIDGPVVARGFCELVQLSANGPAMSRELPERADIQFNGGLARRN